MSGENDRNHHHLHLNSEDVLALRRDGGDRRAFEAILAACDRWISEYVTPAPSHADREEMLDVAFLAVLKDLLSPRTSPKMFRQRLERQLDLQRVKWEEHAAQFVALAETFDQPLQSLHSPDEDLHFEFWVEVVREIEQYMFPALLSLSEKDQDLLTRAYGLQQMADPSRPPRVQWFPSEGARRAALHRARERFSKHLESMLVTALDVHRRERCLLEAALRIVRGKAIAKAMAAVKGLKRER
jgi:hypothetical protein